MLAQNFKTPADLSISAIEQDALVKTLGYLERGDLPGRLNLKLWTCRNGADDCGTVACIAGWAWIFSGGTAFTDVVGKTGLGGHDDWFNKRPRGLKDLFLSADKSSAGAAAALRSYLTHGEPRWAEAISG